MTVFLDGDRITPGTEKCVCGLDCEMPCWQRLGLTTKACCPGCPPLPDFDATVTDISAARGDRPRAA